MAQRVVKSRDEQGHHDQVDIAVVFITLFRKKGLYPRRFCFGRSVMRKIPAATRERLDADPLMHICIITCLTDKQTKIDWHHPFIFGGKQIVEWWATVPISRAKHERIPADKEITERCELWCLNRASDDELRPYCKVIDYIKRRSALNDRYGKS